MTCERCNRKRKQKLYPWFGRAYICGKCYIELTSTEPSDRVAILAY